MPSQPSLDQTVRIPLLRKSTKPLYGTLVLCLVALMLQLGVTVYTHLPLIRKWDSFEQSHIPKLQALEQFDSQIGYGGMIHGLKNFVLRGDQEYLDRFESSCLKARQSLLQYESAGVIGPEESAHLRMCYRLIDSYEAAADRVRLIRQSPSQADAIARVDDTEFFSAINALRKELARQHENQESAVRLLIRQSIDQAAMAMAAISCIVLVFGAWLIGRVKTIVAQNVQELLNHAEQWKQLQIKAESATRAKSAFLATISHEIRTPLTAILGYAELLCDDNLNEDRRHIGRTIHRNGKNLLEIVNDVLDLSKIESGKLTVELSSFPIAGFLDDIHHLMEDRAHSKGLTMKTVIAEGTPEKLHSDLTRLRQIIINLVGNAIKFTETGTVSIHVAATDPHGSCVQFDVQDTGIGIACEERDKLFNPFVQANDSMTREFGGTGLGLCISKRFAERLGGSLIILDSEPGIGSTFRLTLPVGDLSNNAASAPDRCASSLASPQTASRLSKECRILLAEDGVDNQRLISFILEKAGANTTVVENGQLALEAAQAANASGTPYDVILMDLQMPIIGGYKATRTLRDAGYTGPIIALTAHFMSGEREKCIAAGFDDAASKPIDRTALISLVERFLHPAQTLS